MTLWRAITSCGDSALLLPLMAWMALSLLITRRDRVQGLRWIVAVGATGGIVALSKLLFMGWGIGAGLAGFNYTGFSGHTALSVLTWPALAGLVSRYGNSRQRVLALSLAAVLGAGIAVSRLILKAHSVSEVVLGAALGLLITLWFLRGLLRHARASTIAPAPNAATRQLALLGAGALVIGLLCYGRVFPSQHVLQDLALWLSGRPEVFTRQIGLG